MKSYAVIFTYSFDYDVPVYVFATWDEAWDFIEKTYKEELRIDIEENGWESHGTIDAENGYAKIITDFPSGEQDVFTMMIGNVYN